MTDHQSQPTIDSEVDTLVKWSGAPKLIAGDLKQAITNLIAQEANKARLEHSIGILDNVIMLGKDLEYPKEALIDACVRQRDELIKQLGAANA